MSKIKYLNNILIPSTSILLVVVLWQLVVEVSNVNTFPSPYLVYTSFIEIIVDTENYRHIYVTMIRVFSAFSFSFLLAFFFTTLIGISTPIEHFSRPLITIGLTIPAICWTAISVMIFGISDLTAIFASGMIVSPVIITTLIASVKSLDKELLEMGRLYKLPLVKVFTDLIFPQMLPGIFSSIRFGMALTWKVVIIAELLGLSDGVGYKISFWYNLFDLSKVIAWTIIFVIVMLFFEYAILRTIEAKITKWRNEYV